MAYAALANNSLATTNSGEAKQGPGEPNRCANCGHTRCLFHGEDRPPVYNGSRTGVLCWFPVGGAPQYGRR